MNRRIVWDRTPRRATNLGSIAPGRVFTVDTTNANGATYGRRDMVVDGNALAVTNTMAAESDY
ncbi:hypothetical protein [Mycolicibacterium phlei]